MFIDTLSSRISEAIDQLAKLLDSLHRFPPKQRQDYFQKIKKTKTQLISLKTNLKQTNALHTERLYTSLYLILNSLKTQINDSSSLLANKQNRDVNRSHSRQPNTNHSIRHSKNSHDDALRLIAEKEDELAQIKLALFEKEELIKINYEELRDYQRQCAFLREQNKEMKADINTLERQLCKIKDELARKQEEVIDVQLEGQDQQYQLRFTLEELQICRSELMSARQKIEYFEQLAEISMAKTKIVEENIRQVEQEAQSLHQNYRNKETDNIRKHKQIQELTLHLKDRDETIRNIYEENNRLKEDLGAIEAQMTKLQRSIYQLRLQNKQERENHLFQEKEQNNQIQRQKTQKTKLAEELRQNQNKFIDIYNKYTQSEEDRHTLRQTISQLVEEKTQLNNKITIFQDQLHQAQKQLIFAQKQTCIRSEQVEKSLRVSKQYQIQISKLKELIKGKEQVIRAKQQLIKGKQAEKTKLTTTIQTYIEDIKSCERDKAISQRSIASLTEQIRDFQLKIAKLEDSHKRKQQQVHDLKVRLLRSKIQTVHELRQSIRDT